MGKVSFSYGMVNCYITSMDISPYKVACIFLHGETEIVYVVDEGGKLYGVITPSNILDYYRNNNDYINRDFFYLEEIDYCRAQTFFREHPKVHEIPVVDRGKIIGILSSGKRKTKQEWLIIVNDLLICIEEYRRYEYYRKQLKDILEYYKKNGVRVYIVIYPHDGDVLKESDRKIYGIKHKYRCGHVTEMSDYEIAAFFNEDREYAKKFETDYYRNGSIRKNGVLISKDIKSDFFNIHNGYRLVSNAPKAARHKLLVFGPCTALGAYVSDDRTIGYYLQEIINHQVPSQYEVITAATFGGAELGLIQREAVKQGDIAVIFSIYDEIKVAAKSNMESITKVVSVTDLFKNMDNLWNNTFNCLSHHNHVINKEVAKLLYDSMDISPEPACADDCSLPNNYTLRSKRFKPREYYIPYVVDRYYFEKASRDYMKMGWKTGGIIGSIVMNCNPFTKGHRYLIEKALEYVDRLVLFVVEEDLSHFLFKDRIKMVKGGTRDLKDRVLVVGSGKWVISKETFSQYFEKEGEVSEVYDMEYDLRVFGEVVCKYYGITKRFVGEEPTDIVTAQYNVEMERILPEYGIEVHVFPRLKEGGENVSASRVRQYLKEEKYEAMSSLVPTATYDYLMKNL